MNGALVVSKSYFITTINSAGGLMRLNRALASLYSYYELNPSLAIVKVGIEEVSMWLKSYFIPNITFALLKLHSLLSMNHWSVSNRLKGA